jgi:hypothetical protein
MGRDLCTRRFRKRGYFFDVSVDILLVSVIILFAVSVDILLVVSVLIVEVVSAVLFSLSTLLLQAVMIAAMAKIANNFFIVFGLMFKISAKIIDDLEIQKRNRVSILLFFPEEQADGHPVKIELFPQLIFKIVFVRLLYVVGKITKECKGRHSRG